MLDIRRLGVVPDLLLGDLDSIDRSDLKPHELDHLEKIIVPAIKDDTDTQLAVDTAIERGADNIIIIGGLGGRNISREDILGIYEHMKNGGEKLNFIGIGGGQQ